MCEPLAKRVPTRIMGRRRLFKFDSVNVFLILVIQLIVIQCRLDPTLANKVSEHSKEYSNVPEESNVQSVKLKDTFQYSKNISEMTNRIEEQDGISLAFVFDATGSMWNDLQELIKGAKMILEAMTRKKSSLIKNYVFVPYKDPEVGPVTVTTNHTVLENVMEDIDISGGEDCPEMALHAIIEALNASLPYSYLYVFSDATAKDFMHEKRVLDLVQRKKSQVVFILTGDCVDRNQSTYQVYEKIASASSGQIFNLEKNEIYKVLQYVEDTLDSNRVNLGVLSNPTGAKTQKKIAIDSTLQKVTVSIAGGNPKISIIDPYGEKVDGPPRVVKTLDLLDIQIVNIINPEPGNWTVNISSNDSHSLKVTGISNIKFKHGFFIQEAKKLTETTNRPLRGAYNHLMIILENDQRVVNLTSVSITNLQGELLFEVSLKKNEMGNYFTESFLPPDDFFNIEINGFDKDGHNVKRIGSTSVQSQEPEIPYIEVRKEIYAHPHDTVTLKCTVESLVPVNVWWFKNKKPVIDKQQSLQSTEIEVSIFDINESTAGVYVCKALNVAGISSAETNIILEGLPPSVSIMPKNEILKLGTSFEVSCIVESDLPVKNMFVYFIRRRNNGDRIILHYTNEEINGNVTSRFYDNTEYRNSTGMYICEAENQIGKSVDRTDIQIVDQLQVNINVSPNKNVYEKGENIDLTCTIEGSINGKWTTASVEYSGNIKTRSYPDKERQTAKLNLQIDDFSHSNEGSYICTVNRNDYFGMETKSESVYLKYKEELNVLIQPKNPLVHIYKDLNLQCEVSGIPTPKVTWIFKNKTMTGDENNLLNDNGGFNELTISNFTIDQQGEYTCLAENEFEVVNASVTVEAWNKLFIDKKINDTVVNIFDSVTFECGIDGYPIPAYTWFFNGNIINDGKSIMNDKIITLSSVLLENEGIYKCVAKNKYENLEDEAKLMVTGDPPSVEIKPENETFRLGKEIKIECLISSVLPLIDMKIYKELSNGQNKILTFKKSKNNKYDKLVAEQFVLSSETKGLYVCEGENVGGASMSRTLIEVLPPLEAVVKPNVVEFQNGETIKFVCQIFGSTFGLWVAPEKQINDRIIYNEEKSESGVILTLTLVNATENAGGIYNCLAVRGEGDDKEMVNTTAEAIYVQKPFVNIMSKELSFEFGTDASLKCNISGIPQPSIVWKFPAIINPEDKERIYMKSESELIIKNISNTDTGIYSCDANNRFGVIQINVSVSVWSKPFFTKEFQNRTVELYESIELTCDVIGYPKPRIVWFHNNTEIEVLNEMHLKIPFVKKEHAGKYSCFAENEHGAKTEDFLVDIVGLESPIINKTVENFVYKVTKNAEILCKLLNGKPYPSFKWKNDDNYIINYDKFKIESNNISSILHINDLTPERKGNYSCIAENELGSDIYNFQIDVLSPPYFVNSDNILNEIRIIKGENGTLNCEVSGNPVPFITWKKDELPILNSKNQFSRKNSELSIHNAVEDNTGLYCCTANNSLGEKIKQFKVTVLVAPEFNTSDTDITINVIEGQTVELPCKAFGIPDPNIEWLHNGETLVPSDHVKIENDQTLKFTANLTDSGIYSCIASNEVGRVTRDISLFVYVPPSIYSVENVEYSASPGSNIVLDCNAVGFPLPVIKWYFDNELLKNDTDYIINENGQLSIYNINQTNSGYYKCNAENVAGLSQKIFEVKLYEAPIFIKNDISSEIQLKTGTEEFIIPCKATGFPTPSVYWFYNGNDIINGIHHEVQSDGTLKLKYLNNELSGLYSCRAVNIEGFANVDYQVDIVAPPKAEKNYDEIIYHTEGSNVSIMCPLSPSTVSPNIDWFKNGKTYDNYMNKSSINFTNISRNDSGNYTCIASNSMGNISIMIELIVQWPPKFYENIAQDYTIDVKEGDILELSCNVDAHPPADFQWLKDFITLNEVSDVISYMNTKERHSGHYICIAENYLGKVTKKINVNVYAPPEIIGNKKEEIQTAVGKSIILECLANGIPKPSIHWNGSNTSNWNILKNGSILKSHNVSITSEGVYTCAAKNDFGTSFKIINLTVLQPPKIQDVILKNENISINPSNGVYLKQYSTDTISCIASGKPNPEIYWLKNGIKIIGHNRELLLKNISMSENGKYTCVAFNKIGSDEYEFGVNVLASPKIIVDENLKIDSNTRHVIMSPIENHFLALKCQVTGTPPMDIYWFRNNITMGFHDPTVRKEDNGQLLLFDKISRRDTGHYTCVAKNSVGTDEILYELNVLYGPTNEKSYKNENILRVESGKSIELKCDVESNPKSTIRWLKHPYLEIKNEKFNNITLINDNTTMLIANTSLINSGNYSCFAMNPVGFTEMKFTIDVMTLPRIEAIISKLHDVDQESVVIVKIRRGFQLFCNASGVPEPTVVWYKGEKLLENNSNRETLFISPEGHFLNVMDALLTDSGNYSCVASNVVGRVQSEFSVRVVVPAEWSPWSQWSTCSATCGGGQRKRIRKCLFMGDSNYLVGKNITSFSSMDIFNDKSSSEKNQNVDIWLPEQNLDKTLCLGNASEIKYCLDVPCKINGGWTDWTAWTECSVLCGVGVKKRFRSCTNPRPRYGGDICNGTNNQTQACDGDKCSPWLPWSSWTSCSVTCGIGVQKRFRTCDGPENSCLGLSYETSTCMMSECSVNYSWSQWSEWSACTTTCDTGHKKRTRVCLMNNSKVEPKNCNGGNLEIELCEDLPSCIVKHHNSSYRHQKVNRYGYKNESKGLMNEKQNSEAISDADYSEERDDLPFISFTTPTKTIDIENRRMPKNIDRRDGFSNTQSHKETFNSEEDSDDEDSQVSSDAEESKNICPEGYFFNKHQFTCYDINECEEDDLCHETQMCENLPGSYRCLCEVGYVSTGNGKRCLDLDECHRNIHGCSHKCFNIPGSYLCTCPVGFKLGPDQKRCEVLVT